MSIRKKAASSPLEEYRAFDQINGNHSFKEAVPNGFVDYPARTRHGGSVFYFNFRLARVMGLIAKDHPDQLTPSLQEKILETFSIVIINEYDVLHSTPIEKKDIKPNRYMATRYLQLQHPNKQGRTSGDGRGIWNGEFKNKGITWDVSSSGTGATRLSPAHAQTKQFFKTGDRNVGYGNGYNCVSDGLSAALMSEIFHQNGIETEQTLAIISFDGGSSINVRASQNLLRPAHFFHQLKQGNLEGLRASIDYFIDRQVSNGTYPDSFKTATKKKRYQRFAEEMALTFSRMAARFESDYIFCWLDWDGDNILANGGIIDYGSIRQFGLYHWEYRYDDVDRMSTNIPEQKQKAKYIVQTFAQIRDFLISGKKSPIRQFKNDPIMGLFEQQFERTLHELLLKKIGLNAAQSDFLIKHHLKLIRNFKKTHSYFEKTKSTRGVYPVSDGVTCDAIFCMQDIQRELPKRYLKKDEPISTNDFIEIIRSSYAKKRDLKITRYRANAIAQFQMYYLKILELVSNEFHQGTIKKTLLEIIMRASVNNKRDRITGNGVLHVTTSLIRSDRKLTYEQKHQAIEQLVLHQVDPIDLLPSPDQNVDQLVSRNIKAIRSYRDGF